MTPENAGGYTAVTVDELQLGDRILLTGSGINRRGSEVDVEVTFRYAVGDSYGGVRVYYERGGLVYGRNLARGALVRRKD